MVGVGIGIKDGLINDQHRNLLALVRPDDPLLVMTHKSKCPHVELYWTGNAPGLAFAEN